MAKDAGLQSIDDLRRFENSLKTYKDALVESTNTAVHAMNEINQSWDDKVQAAFMQKFMEALSGIKNMAQVVEEHRNYVNKKIRDLEVYLGQ